MANFLNHLNLWNGLLILGGIAVALAGLIRLRHGRSGDLGTQSVATVLAQGVAVLVLGYHMVAWGVNATMESPNLMCVPARWWWGVIVVLGVLVGIARAIDAAEAKQR